MGKQRKGRWLRRILRVLGFLMAFIIISCFLFYHYIQFRRTDKELGEIFSQQHIPASIHYYSTHGRTIRYVSVGNDSLPVLFMIHGSPGSMSRYTDRFNDDT